MRMSMPGRTIPQTQPDRSNWTQAGKNTGKAARTRQETRGQKARRGGAPEKDANRPDARPTF